MRQLVCILLSLLVWLLIAWPPSVIDAGIGLFFAILVATLLSELYPEQPHDLFDPRRWFWALLYLPYFFYYCLRANLDVAYRVLHVDVPVRPGIVRVPTALQNDWARTFLAASITLTPGTLVVDIDDHDLYIHWINVPADDAERHAARIVTRFEPFLRRIFE